MPITTYRHDRRAQKGAPHMARGALETVPSVTSWSSSWVRKLNGRTINSASRTR
ncbi:hypothetical protein ACVOMV_11615 [Mesorhizobium atlanticum]